MKQLCQLMVIFLLSSCMNILMSKQDILFQDDYLLQEEEHVYEKEKFKLITLLYNETNEERISEYITCLERNQANDSIAEIHVLYDTSKDGEENKLLQYLQTTNVTMSYVTRRPSFSYCFNIANTLYPNSRVILSNADIYFNETLALLENYDLSDKLLALTRWNVQQDGEIQPFKRGEKNANDSQDVWIFKTPLRKINCADIKFGTPHCDGKIAYQAQRNRLNVLNPCMTVQCCHLHLSNVRNYDTKTPTPFIHLSRIPWIKLGEEPKIKRFCWPSEHKGITIKIGTKRRFAYDEDV